MRKNDCGGKSAQELAILARAPAGVFGRTRPAGVEGEGTDSAPSPPNSRTSDYSKVDEAAQPYERSQRSLIQVISKILKNVASQVNARSKFKTTLFALPATEKRLITACKLELCQNASSAMKKVHTYHVSIGIVLS